MINDGLHMLDGGSVYVIGAGGGRDVLSALTFGAGRVVAVELNRAILDALKGVFCELTGRLNRDPRFTDGCTPNVGAAVFMQQ